MMRNFRLIFLNLMFLGLCLGCNPVTQGDSPSNFNVSAVESGWKLFEGENIAIALPENFEGGNPARKLNLLVEKLQTLDCVKTDTTEKLEQNARAMALIAFIPQCEDDHLVTTINVISQKVTEDQTLDNYVESEVNKLKNKHEILAQNIQEINQKSVGKIITGVEVDGVKINQLSYVIPQEQVYWVITYSTTENQFKKSLPIFENSVKTVQFLPE
jgi:hypothetical protein